MRTLNSSLPSINQSKIAVMGSGGIAGIEERGLGYLVGRSSSNMMSPHLGGSGSLYN